MNIDKALERLQTFDNQGFYVFTKRDLRRLFFDDSDSGFKQGVARLVKKGLLEQPTKGVYVYALSKNKGNRTVEKIAGALRKGEYNYISLESALSGYGAISQIPIDRITVMTTGRRGTFKTSYGVIEFTHTKRSPLEIIKHTIKTDHPLLMATKEAAYRDLKRVGRNIEMVDRKAIDE
ncbi:type IV toxin-antitoxin system AbiEi family antitoxin domain-containing protein [Shewanella sp. 202IG2-18]|uniref:type IV toxin-antitoxin system AbiEi family antitoxin n=1 Tax=Parashewanella hymeniacidonis TaxID=2807618 RepID=UPI00195FE967|nr:type IV toxin-antitoxin system AbiEi family antitoxin domain-containing protein [Parashewanella hymeniacidonis]MBM7072407.1 type IV toxin-antitoxin system AbiEi family antitoxin domain-containing protein [Parashewanella hymeniacidonis]